MRILHTIHVFPPELRGGTQSYVLALAKNQLARGHDVAILAGSIHMDREPIIQEDAFEGLPIFRVHRRSETEVYSADVGAPQLSALVGEHIASFDPDLLHVHHWDLLVQDFVRIGKAQGRRVVVTLHDLFTTCARTFRMPDARQFCADSVTALDCAKCVGRDIPTIPTEDLAVLLGERFRRYQDELAQADQVFTVSGVQRDLLESIPGFGDFGIKASSIGIPGAFSPTGGEHTPVDGPLRLVNWGGLDPRKGTHVLVKAIAAAGDPSRFQLDIFGGGIGTKYHEELQDLAGDLSIRFHGRYQDEELLAFGPQFDLAVFPTLAFETYGLVVDEALRLGIPILTTQRGAPPERLGGSGLCVPPDDVEALRDELERLEGHREELLAMRDAPHHAADFEKHAAYILGFYQSLS